MRVALVGITAVVILAGCTSEGRAAGLVMDIDTLGVGMVQGFTLRTDEGQLLRFDLEGGTDVSAGGWPPDHLREHLATASGVAVEYRTDGERRIVLRLDDAPWVGR